MKKTTWRRVDLDEETLQQLKEVVQREGSSQEAVMREAIKQFLERYLEEAARKPDRNFEMARVATRIEKGGRRSIADIPEEELLKGFGDDAYSGRWASHRPPRR